MSCGVDNLRLVLILIIIVVWYILGLFMENTHFLILKKKIEKAVNLLSQTHEFIAKMSFYLAGIMILCMIVLVNLEVFTRYIGKPISWGADFCTYLMIYITFFSVGYLYKINVHTRIDVLGKKLTARGSFALKVITSVIGLVVIAILLFQGFYDTWGVFRSGILIIRPVSVPKYMVLIAIPYGFLILFIYYLKEIFCLLSHNNKCQDKISNK